MSNRNNHSTYRTKKGFQHYFKTLDLDVLKYYAVSFIRQYAEVPIDSVILYYAASVSPDSPTKYALVFNTSCKYDDLSESTANAFEKLELNFINLHTLPGDKHREACLGIDAGFSDVYINPEDYRIDEWKFVLNSDESGDLIGVKSKGPRLVLYESSSVRENRRSVEQINAKQRKKSNAFPCKTGTKWREVKITLVADDVVRIETPSGNGFYSYHELKMSDNRTLEKKPSMLWALLKQFAKNQGAISFQNTEYNPRLPDTAKRLNKHLQGIFGIEDSIFANHYKSAKGYKTKIFFSDQTTIT